MELSSPVDRQYIEVEVTATLADGTPADLDGVDAAFLPGRTVPDDETAWTETDYNEGVATVLVGGFLADEAGALVVPPGGGRLWLRVQDSPEVQTVPVLRINVRQS